MNKELSKLTTIVIVTINGNISYEVIDRIYEKYEIIIIENNSDNDFKKNLEINYPKIKIILTDTNVGFGAANNIGVKKTKTPFVLFLGPDVDISLKNIEILEESVNKIKDFSILTPSSNGFNQILKTQLDKFDKDLTIKNLDGDICEIPWVPEWCMYCRISDLKKIDYFDENYFLYYEGLDLCKRLKRIGKKFYLINNNIVEHFFHGTSKNLDKKKTINHWKLRDWHYFWSSFYYHQKYYGYFRSLIIHLSKYFRFLIKKYIYLLTRNEKGYIVNKSKSDGILSSMLLKKSDYRVDL